MRAVTSAMVLNMLKTFAVRAPRMAIQKRAPRERGPSAVSAVRAPRERGERRESAQGFFLASIGISSIVHGGGAVMFDYFETAVTQRILAGMAEGLSEPAAYGVLNQFLSPEQSARVSPFIFAAVYLGQFLGIFATGFMTQRLGWQAPFYIFGGLGIMTWAAVSVGFAVADMAKKRDAKRDALDTNTGDIKKLKSIPVFRIFASTAVWASILLQLAAYFWDPNILPLYFNQSFGTKIELVGVLAGIPILIFGALEPLFALVENILCKHVSTTVARKSMAVIGCLCVSGCLFVAAFTSNSVVAACFVVTAYGSSAAREVVANANIFDIAPRYACVISGISRGISRVVGLTFPLLVTAITKNKTSQEWSRVVLINACALAATALFFGAFGSGEEQPWAVEVPQGQSGGTQPGSRKDHKFDDENRPLVNK
ncbi:SLC17A6 [Branchiostoma lanceolatum]|uniref:SLC17A6 protein n=1 Tax=Branchiostoma lanceolatum TaxID=7740 RepID=A0A8K0EQ58_BRALA|nr:SLC17A6 [Branchiostoma lanceolatum]